MEQVLIKVGLCLVAILAIIVSELVRQNRRLIQQNQSLIEIIKLGK
jgi:hypothetical protein